MSAQKFAKQLVMSILVRRRGAKYEMAGWTTGNRCPIGWIHLQKPGNVGVEFTVQP